MTSSNIQIHEEVRSSLLKQGVNETKDLELDSLTIITLLVRMEERFQIGFDAEDVTKENFSSLENISNLVIRKVQV